MNDFGAILDRLSEKHKAALLECRSQDLKIYFVRVASQKGIIDQLNYGEGINTDLPQYVIDEVVREFRAWAPSQLTSDPMSGE